MSTTLAVDTSIVVPLIVTAHPHHRATAHWRAGRSCVVSGHAWPESYSVLTRLPGGMRVAPTEVVRTLDADFGEPLPLPLAIATELPRLLALAGIAAGQVYDAMVGLAARECGMTLATRDRRAQQTYARLGVDVEMVT